MNRTLSPLLSILVPALFLAACGDGGSGSGNGGSGGNTAAGGSGGSTATGGSGGNTATGGSGGNTATGGSGGTTATGGSGGTTATGACTNSADEAIVTDPNKPIQDSVGTCAQDNFAQEPGTLNCIKGLGLSDACAGCFDDTVKCVFMNCLQDCAQNQSSQACIDCRAQNCDPAFAQCSGLTP